MRNPVIKVLLPAITAALQGQALTEDNEALVIIGAIFLALTILLWVVLPWAVFSIQRNTAETAKQLKHLVRLLRKQSDRP